MTEEQIERYVELQIDGIDRRFMSGKLTQAEYNAAIKAVDKWSQDRARLVSMPFAIT